MTEKTLVKIGLLGTANIAVRSLIPEIQKLKNKFEFVGVATRELNNSTNKTYDFPLVEGYDTLLDKKKIDAVYIPLPNSLHFEWVKEALGKGIHVLVEKSLACTLSEVIELNNLAKEKNLVLLENFQFRFHSQLEYLQDLLQKEVLGEIRYMRSSFCFPPFPNVNNIRYQKDLGGGALLDAGAYPVKLSQILLGNELQVTSAVLNRHEPFDVDIWGGAFLQQKQGKLFSQIAFGFDNYYQCNVEIVGSKGKFYTNRIFTAKENFSPEVILETATGGKQEIELQADNHFKHMLKHFYDLIKTEKDREKEYFDNINQARLLQEIKEKSR